MILYFLFLYFILKPIYIICSSNKYLYQYYYKNTSLNGYDTKYDISDLVHYYYYYLLNNM